MSGAQVARLLALGCSLVVPCAKGTAFVENQCIGCPAGSYQDRDGQSECRACAVGTFTDHEGAQSRGACLAICGNGMSSASGLIPCQLCARHTYAGAPKRGGYKRCEPCADGTFTAALGATSPTQCKKPCEPGHFSTSGLEPCSPCPINFFQPSLGQQACVECENNTITHETGRSLETECRALDCAGVKCANRATCTIENHKVRLPNLIVKPLARSPTCSIDRLFRLLALANPAGKANCARSKSTIVQHRRASTTAAASSPAAPSNAHAHKVRRAASFLVFDRLFRLHGRPLPIRL